jgi:hypothetical protein
MQVNGIIMQRTIVPFTANNRLGKGRPKGSKNKGLSVRQRLDARGFDIVDELLDLIPKLTASEQADVLLQLMGFTDARLKAVELTTSIEQNPPQVIIELPSNGFEQLPGTSYTDKADRDIVILPPANIESVSHSNSLHNTTYTTSNLTESTGLVIQQSVFEANHDMFNPIHEDGEIWYKRLDTPVDVSEDIYETKD